MVHAFCAPVVALPHHVFGETTGAGVAAIVGGVVTGVVTVGFGWPVFVVVVGAAVEVVVLKSIATEVVGASGADTELSTESATDTDPTSSHDRTGRPGIELSCTSDALATQHG